MAHTVFICHSARDKQIADAACAALESTRIPCWIAPRDILPSDEWGAAIVDAINSCQILLLIFSSHSNDSQQVRREVERAVSKGKIILPFRIEDILPSGAMEYALGNTHWLDALTPPLEKSLTELALTVSRILRRSGQVQPFSQQTVSTAPQDPVKPPAAGQEPLETRDQAPHYKAVNLPPSTSQASTMSAGKVTPTDRLGTSLRSPTSHRIAMWMMIVSFPIQIAREFFGWDFGVTLDRVTHNIALILIAGGASLAIISTPWRETNRRWAVRIIVLSVVSFFASLTMQYASKTFSYWSSNAEIESLRSRIWMHLASVSDNWSNSFPLLGVMFFLWGMLAFSKLSAQDK
jgi:hypothetical protein